MVKGKSKQVSTKHCTKKNL